MAGTLRVLGRNIWQTLSSIKTGVILLIIVVIVAAAGTVILQRPVTDPEEMQRAYAPQMLRLLDAVGLTDTFHAWWFVLLLALVSLSIVAASIQRFPNAWRFYARPYKSPDETFRKALATQKQIPIVDERHGLEAAARALRRLHFKPERVASNNRVSLFGERNRISVMAVYIVHTSLLLIFLGGIVDALYGWRGFVALTSGQQSNQVEMRDGSRRTLPFAVRCDGAGQENYADGSPKKWWSKLAVLDGGQEALRKEIEVNDPLVYRGIRFYQASFGNTGKVDKLVLTASPANLNGDGKEIVLGGDPVQLDADTTVRLAEFIPDYVVRDGEVYTRSTEIANPAAHLIVESKSTGKSANVWLPPIPGFEQNAASPYRFEAKELQMVHYTGLEVSHEPGQWAVWAGVIVMGVGLVVVFYLVHMRFWVVPVVDARGQLALWVGGAANKNKEAFEARFQKLVEEIESELKQKVKATVPAREEETELAGV
jgi:cytochrome c biogenesis protein